MKISDFKKEEQLAKMKVTEIRKHIKQFNEHYVIKGYSKVKKDQLINMVLTAQDRIRNSMKKKPRLVVVKDSPKKKEAPKKKASAKKPEKSPFTNDEIDAFVRLESRFRHLEWYTQPSRPYGAYDDKSMNTSQRKIEKAFQAFVKTAPYKEVIKFMKSPIANKGTKFEMEIMETARRFKKNKEDDFKDDVRNDEPIARPGELGDYMELIERLAKKIKGEKVGPLPKKKLQVGFGAIPSPKSPPQTKIINPKTGKPY